MPFINAFRPYPPHNRHYDASDPRNHSHHAPTPSHTTREMICNCDWVTASPGRSTRPGHLAVSPPSYPHHQSHLSAFQSRHAIVLALITAWYASVESRPHSSFLASLSPTSFASSSSSPSHSPGMGSHSYCYSHYYWYYYCHRRMSTTCSGIVVAI